MKATFCTSNDLQSALVKVNQKYDGNIKFNPDSDLPKRFTLRVNGKGKGDAYSGSYLMGMDWTKKRRTGSACWHVHGDFFDALFNINSDAKVYAQSNTITKDHGNWQDFNVGSDYYPAYASKCCECNGEI